MVNADVEDLRRRLDAGDWLTPGEVAKLLGVGRTKMHEMLKAGTIRWTTKPASRHRICNPADVRRELDAQAAARAAAEQDLPPAG